MKDIDFFSFSHYLFLPTRANPKVALVIDNKNLSKNSFKLYNPFSIKAKILKNVSKFSFTTLNMFTRQLGIKKEKSDFINYLEKLLDEELHVSLYFATANDKVVLQLQSDEAKIIAYVKYPLNQKGVQRVTNEIKALEILASKEILQSYMLKGSYKNKPFVVLHELDGLIDVINNDVVKGLVQKFYRKKSYRLENHPRVLSLQKLLIHLDMFEALSKLKAICKDSSMEYALVYEHGDFAPWNIIKVNNEYIPFDFEYFVEDGLEYFDLIKYYYQIGSLLEFKTEDSLKNYVCSKIILDEIGYIYELYLIKEEILKNLERE